MTTTRHLITRERSFLGARIDCFAYRIPILKHDAKQVWPTRHGSGNASELGSNDGIREASKPQGISTYETF
ncbi:hypothetical protein JYU19_01900 [bacterium AH-315-J21]|nr:hypothetical protein [bacterium AH-315-J21]